MSSRTDFPENLHHAPEPGWARSAFTVARAGKVAAAGDYRIARSFQAGQDILYCLSGAGHVATSGQRLDVHAGQLAWIANEAPHAHMADPQQPWTLLWFRFDGPNPADLRERILGGRLARVTITDAPALLDWFERLFATMRRREAGLDLRLNLLVAEFLALIGQAATGRMDGTAPAALIRTVAALRGDLGRSWSAEEIADVAHLGPAQVRRLFRNHLRTSPRQWLTRERVVRAQSLILRNELSLAEIAEACGFCDVYHFSREFKRAVGAPPAAWRKSELWQTASPQASVAGASDQARRGKVVLRA